MEILNNTYLKFIDFNELSLWDVKRLFLSSIKSKYKIVSLKEVIKERSEKVNLYDFHDEKFGILGVNNKEGIFDAYEEIGKNINQSYKKVYLGDLAYNPYRVNVGSVGIKTEKHKFDYISPAYVVFSCDITQLLPEYFYILFKSNLFNGLVNENTTGSVRQNLKFSTLAEIKIPLPSLEEQNRIVEEYNKKLEDSVNAKTKACKLENEIESYLMEELGIEVVINNKSNKGLNIVNYKNLDRWDITSFNNIKSNKYDLHALGSAFNFVNKSWRKKDHNLEVFNYVELGGVDQLNGIIESSELRIKDAPSRATQIINEGDLIIGTTRPYLKRFAIVDKKYDNFVCSSGFSVINKSENYNLEFLLEILFSDFGIEQFKSNMTGALYPAITSDKLKNNIKIPLPPLEIQEKIVKYIGDLKEEIMNLKKFSLDLKESAKIEFEKEIFS